MNGPAQESYSGSPSDHTESSIDEFIALITNHQIDLQAYIMSSLCNHSDSLDVLQLTNIALWKKASQFEPGAPFLPWALKVAKFEILAFKRKRRRDRLTFAPELIEMMAQTAMEESIKTAQQRELLNECIEQLPMRSKELLRHRYGKNYSLREIAERMGLTIDAIKSRSLRIRKILGECIERRMASQNRSV